MQVAPGGLLDRVFREMGVRVALLLCSICLAQLPWHTFVVCLAFRPHAASCSKAHVNLPAPPVLQLPATKWKGLKLLPTAAPSASDETFRQMVRS